MSFSFQGTGALSFAVLDQMRSYWQGLRRGSALPVRDALDPRGMADALDATFLLERIAPGLARFRIAGMHVHDLMGLDVRGMPLSSLFDPAARSRLAEGLESVFAAPATLEMWLEGERGIGRPALEGRMLLLPLNDAQGNTTMALGCLALAGGMGRAPRRFAITRHLHDTLTPQAAPPIPRTSGEHASDFAPLPALRKIAQIHPLRTAPRAKGHLRLVYSRD